MHNTEMKKLVRVLRGVPCPDVAKRRDTEAYQQTTKDAVKDLPRRLRHSLLSMSTSPLCSTHKGLDHHLMEDIFDWVRHELDGGIGKFIYPLIMHNKLTISQEYNIRCLEPVLQMWRKDFKAEASAPPDRTPIDCGSRWKFQDDQCAACILARIGSDDSVLRALYAGMIVRLNSEKLGWAGTPLSELNARKLDKPKSKRVRFVRYWVKACASGDHLLTEAAEMGLHMRRAHIKWKRSQCQRPSFYQDGRSSMAGNSVRTDLYPINPFRDPPAELHRPRTAVETERWLHPKRVYQPNDPKIGPNPRPQNVRGYSTGESLGFNPSVHHPRVSSTSHHHPRDSPESSPPLPDPELNRRLSHHDDFECSDSDTTIHPCDSASQAPFRTTIRPNDTFSKVSQRVEPLHIQKKPHLGRSHIHTSSLTRSQQPTNLHPGPSDVPVLGNPPRPRRHDSILSTDTLAQRRSQPPRAPSSILPHEHPAHRAPSSLHPRRTHSSRQASVLSGTTINMEEDDMRPVFDPLETREERLSRIKRLLKPLPVPSEGSVYGGFGDEDGDPFEDVDEEELSDGEGDDAYGGAEEVRITDPFVDDGGRRGSRRVSRASTNWDDLY
jgi:hypothetical protein